MLLFSATAKTYDLDVEAGRLVISGSLDCSIRVWCLNAGTDASLSIFVDNFCGASMQVLMALTQSLRTALGPQYRYRYSYSIFEDNSGPSI